MVEGNSALFNRGAGVQEELFESCTKLFLIGYSNKSTTQAPNTLDLKHMKTFNSRQRCYRITDSVKIS